MRFVLVLFIVGIWAIGCAHVNKPSGDHLSEVDKQLVTGCVFLGLVDENADAGNPIPYMATKKMIQRVKARAAGLGATHLVWLHKTKLSAAAEAYRCPSSK